MNPRLRALQAEFDRLRSGIDAIHNRAATDGNRDLTEEETADADALYDRAEKLRPEIEALAEKHRSFSATADVLQRLGMAPAPAATAVLTRSAEPEMTAGEYLAMFHRAERFESPDAIERLRAITEHARATQALADNAGVVPTLILGDLIKFVDSMRPTINSLTRRPMFKGDGRRPRVTQTTQVGAQAAEFDTLSSRKMAIVKDNLSRGTYGGYVEISEQDDEFTDPGMLQILLEDLAEQYGIITDDVVADALVAAATNTYELTGTAGALSNVTNANLHKGLWAAALQVYTQCKRLPDGMWCAPDVWAEFGGRVDTTDRPLYPSMGTTNASGSMTIASFEGGKPIQLDKFVVDPNFAAGTLILGNSKYGEVYEQDKGMARSLLSPSKLSTEVGYRGYLSTYFRAEGFVKVVNAA